jgi:hypothetical protein
MSGLTVAICRIVNVRAAAFRYDRFTSIPLKNSNFCVDHSSEDRWQPQ